MTLVEVMVAAAMFALVATSLVGIFMQSQRFSYFLGYRTQAVTISLSILEQLRFRQYAEILDVYNAGNAGNLTVTLPDPSDASGYTNLTLPVNLRDNTEYRRNWTTVSVAVDPSPGAPRLPMRFFLHLKRNHSVSTPKVDVFEVVLLYQWLRGGASDSDWQTGNVRLVVPNLNPV